MYWLQCLRFWRGFSSLLLQFCVILYHYPPGSWRKAENQRDMVERKLIRHMWLFGFYLVIIGLIFLITLLRAAENVPNSIRTAVDFIFLWFGVAGFLFSLTLPKTLMDIQRDRVNAEIERRRREENIPPDT